MSGILTVGKYFCEGSLNLASKVGLQPENLENICSLPSTQKVFLLGVIGSAALAICSHKTIQRWNVEKLDLSDPVKLVSSGNLSGAKEYLKRGGDVNATDMHSGNSLLGIACDRGHFGIVKEILSYSPTLEHKNKKGESPIHIASANRNSNIVELLLKKNADPNALDQNNQSPLMIASKKGAFEIVRKLVEAKCQVNTQNKQGQTALHLAAKEFPSIVNYLLQNSGDPDLVDNQGWTPLHVASDAECIEAIHHLLKKMKDVNAKDKEGNSALHLTALQIASGVKSAETLLADPKINPDLLDNNGETALHLAYPPMTGKYDLPILMLKSKRFNLESKRKLDGADGKQIAKWILEKTGDDIDRATKLCLEEIVNPYWNVSGVKNEALCELPEEAICENGEKITERNIAFYTPQELQTIRIRGFTLIEWSVLHANKPIRKFLNQKNIFFQLTQQNEAKLISELLKIFFAWNMKRLRLIPYIREMNQIKEQIERFLENPDITRKDLGEFIEISVENARNYFKRHEIIDEHKQKETHIYGMEYLDHSQNFDLFHFSTKEGLELVPPQVRGQIENSPSLEEIENIIPQRWKFLLRERFDLKRVASFWPVITKFLQLKYRGEI